MNAGATVPSGGCAPTSPRRFASATRPTPPSHPPWASPPPPPRASRMLFFSSRSRHTRLQGDWNSDVCSSDLVAWRDRSVGKGSLIYADRHLYALGEEGVVGLVDATPAGYHEISRFEIPKGGFPTWSQ